MGGNSSNSQFRQMALMGSQESSGAGGGRYPQPDSSQKGSQHQAIHQKKKSFLGDVAQDMLNNGTKLQGPLNNNSSSKFTQGSGSSSLYESQGIQHSVVQMLVSKGAMNEVDKKKNFMNKIKRATNAEEEDGGFHDKSPQSNSMGITGYPLKMLGSAILSNADFQGASDSNFGGGSQNALSSGLGLQQPKLSSNLLNVPGQGVTANPIGLLNQAKRASFLQVQQAIQPQRRMSRAQIEVLESKIETHNMFEELRNRSPPVVDKAASQQRGVSKPKKNAGDPNSFSSKLARHQILEKVRFAAGATSQNQTQQQNNHNPSNNVVAQAIPSENKAQKSTSKSPHNVGQQEALRVPNFGAEVKVLPVSMNPTQQNVPNHSASLKTAQKQQQAMTVPQEKQQKRKSNNSIGVPAIIVGGVQSTATAAIIPEEKSNYNQQKREKDGAADYIDGNPNKKNESPSSGKKEQNIRKKALLPNSDESLQIVQVKVENPQALQPVTVNILEAQSKNKPMTSPGMMAPGGGVLLNNLAKGKNNTAAPPNQAQSRNTFIQPQFQAKKNQPTQNISDVQNMRRATTLMLNNMKIPIAAISNLHTIKSNVGSSSQNSDSESDFDINAGTFSESQSDEEEDDQEERDNASDSFRQKYLEKDRNDRLTGVLVTPAGEKHGLTKGGNNFSHGLDEVAAAKNFYLKQMRKDSEGNKFEQPENDQELWQRTKGNLRRMHTEQAAQHPFVGGLQDSGKSEKTSNAGGFLQGFGFQFSKRRASQDDKDRLTENDQNLYTGQAPETKRGMIEEINVENASENQDPGVQQNSSGNQFGSKTSFKRSNMNLNREQTIRSQKDGVNPGLYDEYYAALYNKDVYCLRDIYPDVNKSCLLLPDDPFKTKWEIYISLILVFTAISTPYRIAFVDSDNLTWTVINYIVDASFFFDIIFCFFSAYEDENEELIYDRCTIARSYCFSWFFIDVVSILPISELLQTGDFASLARIARLPKLYRLIRMFKLIRLLKVIKERNTISKYLNEVLKLSVAIERLAFFCFLFVILVHITSCFWVILTTFEDSEDNFIIRNNAMNLSAGELYVMSFYFTTVIVTTIGYGDITVRTPMEQLFALILLIVGVIGFSFAIGGLSSVLSTLDAKAAKLKEKLSTLEDIRTEYKVPYDLYRRLRLALNYDHSKNAEEHLTFLNDLPASLKVELSVVMHQELVKSIQFFRHKQPHFIAYIAPLLKPFKVEKDQYIYKEGDPIDEIYFLVSGMAGYALPDFDNAVYLIVDQGYYFGEIDFIVMDERGENVGTREFSTRSIEDSDLLILSKNDLLDVDQEFDDVISQVFQNAFNRLKRTQLLKKKCIRFYKKLYKQREIEERQQNLEGFVQKNTMKSANGDGANGGGNSQIGSMLGGNGQGSSQFKANSTYEDANVGAFLKSLTKKWKNNLGSSAFGKSGVKKNGLPENMMKDLDNGDLGGLIGEQSSRSSIYDSESSYQNHQVESSRKNGGLSSERKLTNAGLGSGFGGQAAEFSSSIAGGRGQFGAGNTSMMNQSLLQSPSQMQGAYSNNGGAGPPQIPQLWTSNTQIVNRQDSSNRVNTAQLSKVPSLPLESRLLKNGMRSSLSINNNDGGAAGSDMALDKSSVMLRNTNQQNL